MIGKTLVHYRILEKLGEGGMGAVYRAHDDRLQRDVAVKVLTSSDLGARREDLLHEARTASKLKHPGICTLHDVGTTEDVDFFVMELVEGRTLREVVAGGPTDEERVLDWGLQIASAAGEAHAGGVVHGDLKPGNVMLSFAGRIIVLDFGLARVIADPGDTEATVRLSETGPAGTVPFMAPEQLRGQPADARSDVFALGAVLYALLTGKQPFGGDTSAVVIDAILNRDPEPLRRLRPDVSPSLKSVVERCLAKDPATRYESGAQLAADLEGIRRGETVAGGGDGEKAVAVLFFENLGGSADDDYFCDGVTEDLITEVAKIGSLRVFPRSTVAAFRGSDREATEVGRQLGSSHVVEGSLRRAGERLRVTARLIRTDSGHTVWSERFDRTLEDVFAIQDEIARAVARALQVALTDQEKRDLDRSPTFSFSAYDFYLRGRQEFNRVGLISSGEGLEWGISMYRKSIAADPEYARAWAGIAEYRCIDHQWYGGGATALREADEASLRALELDPELAEVLSARAQVVTLQGRWEEGRELFDRAIERWPRYFEAYYLRARLEFAAGGFEEAVRFFRLGMEAHPDDVQCPKLLAMTLDSMGRKEEAVESAEEALRRVENRLGIEGENPFLLDGRAQVLAYLGRREEAVACSARALALSPEVPALRYNTACLLAKSGQEERAIEILVPLLKTGFGSREWIENDPDLAGVRSDPRVRDALESYSAEARGGRGARGSAP